MTGDPLADLIASTIWGTTYDTGSDILGYQAANAAAAVREWIVEQIDHERRDWGLVGWSPAVAAAHGALDDLQARIGEGAT